MSDPIDDPAFWKHRLETAKVLHHSIYKCPLDLWQRIEERHRQILAATIGQHDSVLDSGCGWGRLLDLMPVEWQGDYKGIDLSPDFIEMARRSYPRQLFATGDLRFCRHLLPHANYDWAVLISIRGMVQRNQGDEVWAQMEAELHRVARQLLFLEYDENDPGRVK